MNVANQDPQPTVYEGICFKCGDDWGMLQGVCLQKMFALRLECLQQSSSEATPHCHTTTTAQFAQFCRPCHAAAPHATAPCHGIFGRITDAEENGEEEPWQEMDVSKNNVTPKSSTLIGFPL